jgi:PKD repeat protein
MERSSRFGTLHRHRAVIFAIAAFASACAVDKQDAPTLTGPSGFAQSLQVTAAPQILSRDGSSMSTISVLARNADGTPLANRRLLLEASAGTLTATEVNTNSNGAATTTYVAPGMNEAVNAVTIIVTPIEAGDRVNAHGTSLIIEVLGPDIPVPSFSFTPTAPVMFELVRFDASASALSGQPCGSVCTYDWTFPDGSTDTGRFPSKRFETEGPQLVTLTVTAPVGTHRTLSRVVNVAAAAAPTADFTFSPSDPLIFDQVFFDGTKSKAHNGATIVTYEWNFGNGTYGTGPTPPAVVYTRDRTFNVSLTVTDSRGMSTTVTKPIAIAVP